MLYKKSSPRKIQVFNPKRFFNPNRVVFSVKINPSKFSRFSRLTQCPNQDTVARLAGPAITSAMVELILNCARVTWSKVGVLGGGFT